MFKVIIGIVLFCISSYIGYFYGESFRKRYVHLKEVNKIITLLQNEVLFNTTPLPEALSIVGSKTIYPFKELLIDTSNNLSHEGLITSFKSSYLNYEKEIYFYEEDKHVLQDFIKSLGDTGLYGQEKIFKLVLENLKINLKDALELSEKNTKMYRYLGLCMGAMIFIFII